MPHAREKSGNWVKKYCTSGQGKVGELSKKYLSSEKSQGTEWKIPQVIEKSGNWVKNTSGQGKVNELSETIPKVRENSLNWVKNTSNNGIVVVVGGGHLESGERELGGAGGTSSQRTQARWSQAQNYRTYKSIFFCATLSFSENWY